VCLGTFFVLQMTAVFHCKWILKPNGEKLIERIQLAAMSEQGVGECKDAVMALSSELVARGNASLTLVARFTEYHYIAIIAALASGTLGGIATFLIGSLGWAQANDALRGFFAGCAGSLSFWLTAIQVFKYQESIAKHEAVYVACANLLSELRFAVLTPPPKDSRGAPMTLPDFLASLARRMDALRNIGISFDGSKIGFIRIDSPR
jgi:hypothetical protein